MKIATFNVNGLTGRLPAVLRWLADAEPDVVCLQELKTAHDKFPCKEIEQAGYRAIWKGQSQWNGVAILTRGMDPLLVRDSLPGDAGDTQSRYIEAAVNGILFGCLYLPNGNPAPGPKFDYKLAWFERLRMHAQDLLDSGAPVVLAGDYNVMPEDIDVYAPERWGNDALFRLEVRYAYRRLLRQGWVDAIRARHPHEHIFTFWHYWRDSFLRDAGLRIDHVLLSPNLNRRLISADVHRKVRALPKASDHAPVCIEIRDKPPHRRR